jgi:GAF domain-containing protein
MTGVDRLTLFNSFTQVLQRVSAEMASQEVLNAACQSVVEYMPNVAHAGVVFVTSESLRTGKVVAEYPPQGSVGVELVLNENLYRQMIETELPVPISNLNHPETSGGLDEGNRQVLLGMGIQAIMIVPFVFQKQLLGSLGLDIKKPYEFSADEIEVMSAIGRHIAVSIRNSQLYAESEQRLKSQALTHQITQRLPLRSDLNSLLKTAAEEIGRVLGATEARIHILTPTGQEKNQPSPS